ncbi:MAG: hypothetical protein H0W94_06110 [Actinobacteria bacterium]|nr:hypothetical protein [Actinomycetota bacterium]
MTRSSGWPLVAALVATLMTACAEDGPAPLSPAAAPSGSGSTGRLSPTPLPPGTDASAEPSAAVPAGCSDLRDAGPVVTIVERDNAFEPACLVVALSQALSIENRGSTAHTFTVVDPGGGLSPRVIRVDLETPPGGVTNTEVIGQILGQAPYPLYCRFHQVEGMVGTVVVQ